MLEAEFGDESLILHIFVNLYCQLTDYNLLENPWHRYIATIFLKFQKPLWWSPFQIKLQGQTLDQQLH